MEIPDELVEAKRALEWGLLALPGVLGVGLGMREQDGEHLDELAVRVVVADLGLVPDGLPAEVAGVAVCLVEGGYEPCAFPDDARYDDLVGGVRIAQPSHGNGTLGALVEDPATGQALGLTCRHVVGDPSTFPDGVFQPREPAMIAGGTIPTADHVGDVLRSDFPRTPPLPFAPQLVGTTDSAVVSLDGAAFAGRTLSAAVADQGPGQPPLVAAVTGRAEPDAALTRVRKRGFVTGVTAGLVIGCHLTHRWSPGGPMAYLVDQFEILGDGVFCDEGDSGSLVLEEGAPTAVGLLWGRNPPGQFRPAGRLGVASPITAVESALGISVVFS